MTGAEFIVDHLISLGVTDVYGVPGGVILELIYELDRRKGEIAAHLSYHEQCAGFAASGYAQVSGRLGVAYATKGPGIANLLTPVADAYGDSTPMLVITAHSEGTLDRRVRFTAEQELDTVAIFGPIVKYAARIDSGDDLAAEARKACRIALEGRKGPVLIDVLSSIFSKEIPISLSPAEVAAEPKGGSPSSAAECIAERLKVAQRPILLIGDGIHSAGEEGAVRALAEEVHIPVLSSRYAGDVMPCSDMYYGYIGSHGVRYANFVLSKADLIIAFGNRLAFPVDSESFGPLCRRTAWIRVENDFGELQRQIPNCESFHADVGEVLRELLGRSLGYRDPAKWKDACDRARQVLWEYDVSLPVRVMHDVFQTLDRGVTIVNDVGNNEFWSSRACIYSKIANRTLYSKSFGALGCSLGKSIGVFYATKRPVLCVTGDQGLQFNSQELQYIGMNRLPIAILLLNNRSSGMIRSREKQRYGRYVHTTYDSGYGAPDFRTLAKAYGIDWFEYPAGIPKTICGPSLIEVKIDEEIDLEPYLPRGNSCERLSPEIDEALFEELGKL